MEWKIKENLFLHFSQKNGMNGEILPLKRLRFIVSSKKGDNQREVSFVESKCECEEFVNFLI